MGWGGGGDRDKLNHVNESSEADAWHVAALTSRLCLEQAPRGEEV